MLAHGRPALQCLHCPAPCKHTGCSTVMHSRREPMRRKIMQNSSSIAESSPTAQHQQQPRHCLVTRTCPAAKSHRGDNEPADSTARLHFAIPVSLRFAKLVKDHATVLTAYRELWSLPGHACQPPWSGQSRQSGQDGWAHLAERAGWAGLTWPGHALDWTPAPAPGAAPPAWPRLVSVFLAGKTGRPVIRCMSPGGGEVSDFASRQGHAYQKAGEKLYPRLGWSHRPSPV